MISAALVIDSNLGFAFWLANVLDIAGYQAFPARSVADALDLISDIKMNVQLLILGGAPADAVALVANLRGQFKDLRVLHLLDGKSLDQPMPGVDLASSKPEGKTEIDRAELLLLISSMFSPNVVS